MGTLALMDSRKRVHDASLVSYFGKVVNGFSGLGFDLVKLEDLMPAKKQKVTPPWVASEHAVAFQSSKISIVTSTITSRKSPFPHPAPLPREVHGPQRSPKFISSTSLSWKSWEEASATRKGSGDISLVSKEKYMACENRLVETRRQALEYVGRTRRDITVTCDSPQCSKLAKSNKPVSSCKCLSSEVMLSQCLDVENYRRMVDGVSSIPASKKFHKDLPRAPQKSLDAAFMIQDDGSQPSTPPVIPGYVTLCDEDGAFENMGKPVISRVVNLEHNKPAYKELQESIDKNRLPALRIIDLQIKLELAKLDALSLIRKRTKTVVEDQFHKPFDPLTAQEKAEVSIAFNGPNRQECLVMHENSNIEITRNILQCLLPGAWLNDEVINLYLELLKEREVRNPKQFLQCHFFNTFFYKKLTDSRNGYDYKAVRRWTTQKKIGYSLIECDKIFVPIHKEIHWCLAVINVRDKKFQYLDSLGGMDFQVLEALARYLTDEVKDKNGKVMDFSSWEQELVSDLPEQKNGYDCGMFMIKYADFYSRGMNLSFTQEHMPYFRKRTAKEILHLRAD